MSKVGRRWAPSLAGSPQIRSVPEMGWVKVQRKGRFEVDDDMPEDKRKSYGKQMFERFVQWMKAEDGAEWDGNLPTVQGPYPHFNAQPPDMQYGDNGASRLVARNVQEDLTGTGKEDYVIIASFWVREQVQELRSPVAEEVVGRGGIRALREVH